MVELSNGCVCCPINSDLADTVFTVLHRDDKAHYLVVETTGIADPQKGGADPSHDALPGSAPVDSQRRRVPARPALFGRPYGLQSHASRGCFDTLSFEADRRFASEKFQQFLEWLPEEVFRAKGLISVDEREKLYTFHLVGQRFTLDASDRVEPVKNRLVLIGRNLDRQQLLRRLRQCLVS